MSLCDVREFFATNKEMARKKIHYLPRYKI